MIYRGKVRGGVVVLQPGIQLPEELDVTVEPVLAESRPSSPVSCSAGMRNGVPIFARTADGPAPGLDLVNKLRDETPWRTCWTLTSWSHCSDVVELIPTV